MEGDIDWLTIQDNAQSVVEDVERIRRHPLVPKGIPIYGYLFDGKSGKLMEAKDAALTGKAAQAVGFRTDRSRELVTPGATDPEWVGAPCAPCALAGLESEGSTATPCVRVALQCPRKRSGELAFPRRASG
jgi:hypothetical protein